MSSLTPKIRHIIVFDALLFIIGVAGIYHLVERAGINTTSDLKILISDKPGLVFEKIINPDLNDIFADQDTLKIIDTFAINSVDELEVITDSKKINDIVETIKND